MPSRVVREAILRSERVDKLADLPAAEVFYRRVLNVVDDFGRYPAHPSLVRAAAYPLRLDKLTNGDVAEYLARCVDAGLVQVYEVEGKAFLQVLNFGQQMRAKKSKYPAPDTQPQGDCGANAKHLHSTCVADNERMRGGCAADDRRLRPESESESESEAEQSDGLPLDLFFEEIYSQHPKKRDRVLAQHALAQVPGIETAAVQSSFRRSHQHWCKSEGWLWKEGASAPTLAVFISDKGYAYDPKPPEVKRKPSSEGVDPYVEWVPPVYAKDD